MKQKILIVMSIVSTLLLATAIVALAQGKTPTDDEVNAVAKKLYCPVCPNTPLDVCETKACEDWRAQIRDELASGWTEQQILDYFVAQYGERVLAEPQRRGFTSLVWMLPVIGVIFGVFVVWQVLRIWKKDNFRVPARSSVSSISPEVMKKIEKELREIE
jgi:cytochrome c-type biogenesis protein CcmH